MTHPSRRDPLRVLIAGGGVAALEAALALRELADDRVDVELLAPEPQFWYRPLAVLEPFGGGGVHGLELSELADACGARFTLGSLASVDAAGHVAITAAAEGIPYDVLLVATGARPVAAVAGALTFRGPADAEAFAALLSRMDEGEVRRLAFALPGGTGWTLPLYELALLTAARPAAAAAELTVVTPEPEPLSVFGDGASRELRALLEERGIAVLTGRYPVAHQGNLLRLAPRGAVLADAVVALPRLRGVPIPGIPHDGHGFVPTDASGRVEGVEDVFAAGDVTAFPVAQGGLAAQEACAAAEAIAARAGADVTAEPFRPVLRGLLLTGTRPAYLRTELRGGAAVADPQPLWWPPAKIAGRYLAPFLAERAERVLGPPS